MSAAADMREQCALVAESVIGRVQRMSLGDPPLIVVAASDGACRAIADEIRALPIDDARPQFRFVVDAVAFDEWLTKYHFNPQSPHSWVALFACMRIEEAL